MKKEIKNYDDKKIMELVDCVLKKSPSQFWYLYKLFH